MSNADDDDFVLGNFIEDQIWVRRSSHTPKASAPRPLPDMRVLEQHVDHRSDA
jgi:hypothetical protein